MKQRGALTVKEVLLACAAMTLVAAATFGPHVSGWGFFLDDWADAANRYYPAGGESFSNVMTYFSSTFDYRPVLVVFTPLKYFVFGSDMPAQFVWTLFLAVAIATMIYGILRHLGVPWIHAGLIGALTLIYPWFDSTRLWESANPAPLSITIALAGFCLALVGLARRSWRWHVGAAVLYLISVLTYEVTLPLILVAGVVYTVRGGWKEARWRWAADIVAAVAGGLWVGTHTTRNVSGLDSDLSHLGEIVERGFTIVARSFLPVGQDTHETAVLLLAVAVALAGVAVYLRRRRAGEAETGWGMRGWLLLASAGAVVTVLGWTIYIPADPYYTPSVFGVDNRVNALAGYGLVILVYALVGVACSVFAEFLPAARRYVAYAVPLLAVLLGAAYVHVLDRHIGVWEEAYSIQRAGIAKLKATYPKLPPESTVFTSGYPAYLSPGVPIFAASWDANGMIKLEYEDGSLSAYPMLEGMTMVCGSEGISLAGPGAVPVVSPYGKARLLNLGNGRHVTPRDRRQCLAVADRFVPGPLIMTSAY
jgi:hypothetical protein